MAATQESTQPTPDARLNEEDVADIVCILHPNSPAAHNAVSATAEVASQHILQRDELGCERLAPAALDLALRLSSDVKDPTLGFYFGRNRERCDIFLSPDDVDKKISNMHFRIYLTMDGVLMLQDTSTNGTIVNNQRLRKAAQDNSSRHLVSGSVIQVVGSMQQEIRFVVRIPAREGFAAEYTENLLRYFQRIQPPAPVKERHRLTMPARPLALSLSGVNHHSMHWNGGGIYNIIGTIGKGAFATVYKIARVHDGHVYACKELDKHKHMKNGVMDQKVHNEMKIMKDLKHPNIVEFVDYHEEEKHLYIVMEYVSCGELSTYLQSHRRLPEDMVRTVTRQLLHALQYLHRRKITHRDIKPDNILISSLDPLKVKLSDFGLSKVTQEETFLKTFCGTLLYCAPEVYPEFETYRRGEFRKRRRLGDPLPKTSPYNQSVDIWSLGAVLFHVLSGVPPYFGTRDNRGAQMLHNIMTTEPDFDLLRSIDISEGGIDFLARLLRRHPHDRPKIRECLEHQWIATVPDVDVYEDNSYTSDHAEGLAAIGEDVEEELDASQLSLNDDEVAPEEEEGALFKRPRIERLPIEVHYPSLPFVNSVSDLPIAVPANPRRLFGEVTRSVLQSSGIFGERRDALDVRLSVPDFISSTVESMDDNNSMDSVLSLPEGLVGGPAPSLMGAEKLVGQLNMNSSHSAVPGTLQIPWHETPTRQTDPAEPSKQEATKGSPETKSLAFSNATPRAANFSRRIELPLPETASECSSAASSREENCGSDVSHEDAFDIELAVTIGAKTGQEITNVRSGDGDPGVTSRKSTPTDTQESSTPGPLADQHLVGPLPLLGKLVTLPGSIFDLTIRLERRLTSWGRGPKATICYDRPLDARVPAYALEVTFWAPAIESDIAAGTDWMTVPGVIAILSTKTSKCIWVNDMELRRGPNVHQPCYGKLYTGDIITIYQYRGEFLKFRCEFYHGDSARLRPDSEKGFQVRSPLSEMRPSLRRHAKKGHGSGSEADNEASTS